MVSDVSAIWAAAKVAAEALEVVVDAAPRYDLPRIHLGCSWSAEELASLARLAGVPVVATLYLASSDRPAHVIEHVTAEVAGVSIEAMCSRPATPADAGLDASRIVTTHEHPDVCVVVAELAHA